VSLEGDIPAGDGITANLFLPCNTQTSGTFAYIYNNKVYQN
jgi:hypothetical protein